MKKDRGSITIITLVTILFMLSFLISTYMIISNRRQAQTEIKRETQEIYESDTENIDAIYNSYFAGEGEVIPIYTEEQLLKISDQLKKIEISVNASPAFLFIILFDAFSKTLPIFPFIVLDISLNTVGISSYVNFIFALNILSAFLNSFNSSTLCIYFCDFNIPIAEQVKNIQL